MKMKSLFVAALATVALASCAKDEPAATGNKGAKTNFAVTLPGAINTYAVEDPQGTGTITPYYEDVTVYLVDGGANATAYEWSDAEILAKERRFEQIVEPAKVIVIVNKGNVTLPATTTETALADALKTLTAEMQNKAKVTLASADAKGNAAADYLSVQRVTLYGVQTTFTTEAPDADGHDLKKADVELKSLVSRFEVGTVKPGTGLISLMVKNVYINYFYDDYSMTSAKQYTENAWPLTAPYDPDWATDAADGDVTSNVGTKAYAYQVFAGDLVPHIIYEVDGEVSPGYKLADGSEGPFTGKFITVKGFQNAGASLTAIEAHKIYKMGLTNGGIEITPEEITDKPEKSKTDLIVAITVAEWEIIDVTPEI